MNKVLALKGGSYLSVPYIKQVRRCMIEGSWYVQYFMGDRNPVEVNVGDEASAKAELDKCVGAMEKL